MIALEEAVMEIIVNAGQSRSLCFEALHAARQGNLDEAKSLLREADGYARQAHKMQTKLIEQDAGEAPQPMTLIMVHAQDHLMNSLLARELSEEIIHLYQR
ncbi:PTS lactose/cellobiose transporter subunit IIA [Enterobacter hormaechei]|jgi:PTS system cellobiose-specific IIA component|uniref:PTS lactose/cellobiose transporter subunit IIA n=1 Tax=Enterobacter cloacae complex TaxID=354276 RepID=UPI0023FA2259|nr:MULTISPECIES: PTS lactose/cellobiose transporter subunit IIA [Enterobacter cloacae complex]HBM7613984.1 PTS lactose/cellobiose transporter subunit IIA [Enterobacter hormaechei subsp. xiangfangensis]MDF9197205.1 PTS lactose/cellobiose transporter subunit IIA [Enterobacter hormaechei]MDF9216078.1 PTS lactose/cellobiose transporter subunit IIA [Enterobacter hormaechei]MDF9262044.1 PTS lactose/cellobiose transporter subunit IIA [Enterobacter hormaechei]MEA3653421.1 PTS lactose/cellobiose transp